MPSRKELARADTTGRYREMLAAGIKSGDDNFCAVMAFSVGFGTSFATMQKILDDGCHRQRGEGTHTYDVAPRVAARFGKTLKTVYAYNHCTHGKFAKYSTFGCRATHAAVATSSRMTIEQFCERNPKGRFLVVISRHVLCVRNGKVHDWSGREGQRNRMVHCAWQIIGNA